MNYRRIYDELIEHARFFPPSGYTESHHILPECRGGTDEPENLVELTARQHFVVHQLLAKICGGPLIIAAFLMTTHARYTSRDYKWLQEKHAEIKRRDMMGNKFGTLLKGIKRPDVSRRLIGNQVNKGRRLTKDHINRCTRAIRSMTPEARSTASRKSWQTRRQRGTDKPSAETRAKISKNHACMVGENNPRFGVKLTQQHKELLSAYTSKRMLGNQHTRGMKFKFIDGRKVCVWRPNGDNEKSQSRSL